MPDQLNLGLKIETPPPRPDACDDATLRKIAEHVVKDMCLEESLIDTSIDDVAEVLGDEWDWDGYSLAKALDDTHGWEIDGDTVEALNASDMLKHRYIRNAVKEWVKRFDIKPMYSVGDCVDVKWKGHRTVQGEITGIHDDSAEYIIFIFGESEQDSLQRSRVSNTGYLIAYENVIGITGANDGTKAVDTPAASG